MSLLDFKDFLHKKKAPEQPTSVPSENMVTKIDDQIATHHQTIENNIASATRESVEQGSSIPTANTTPGNPLMVIQGASEVNPLEARQVQIDATLPNDYQNIKTGFGNTWDRNLLGKDGMTTPDEFLAKQAERESAKKAIQAEAIETLKKAA